MAGKPPSAMAVPQLYTHLRNRGIPVWFLGVNSEEELQAAQALGATGVLSDRINFIKGFHCNLQSINTS